jgi:cell division protein FtsN
MSKNLIVRILLLLVCVSNTYAQPVGGADESMVSKEFRPSIGLGMGMINYYGDVNSNENHGSFHNQFGYTIHISRKINSSMDLGFSFLTGTIVGNERSVGRNLNFKTSIYSGSVYVSYNFNHFLPENSVLQPYITLGFESFEYNNKSDLVDANGNKYFYWTDGTIRSIDQQSSAASQAVLMKRDYVYETDLRAANLDGLGKYAQLSIGVPLGFGVNMKVNDRINFKIGSTFHFTFTDLIDNVSKEGTGVRQGSSTPDFFMFNSLSLHYDLLNTPKRVNLEDFYFPDFFVLDMVDQDKDGVVDGFDLCPYTPEGVKVDDNGCSLDSDDDGVPDYLDQEVATIDTSFVNSDGITLTDEYFQNQYLRYIDSVDIPIDILYRIAGKPQKSATYMILLGEFSGRLPEDLAKDFLDEGDVFGTITKGGRTAYLAGEYSDIEKARQRQKELLAKGMPQATIVVWEGNDFITLKKWEDKSKKEVEELYKDEIKKKEDLNGMYAVKLGNTGADASAIDKLSFFEYEDVVVLDGDRNSSDYVVGPFIDSVGASQVLQEVDRAKFPDATIVKVKNGKVIKIDANTDEAPVNDNQKGAISGDSPKYKKKEESNKLISKLENSFVIDFGFKKNPKTKALIEKIKAKADVIEVIDPKDGSIKLITKDRKTKSEATAEVVKLKSEGISTAKVARVKNGEIIPVKESELNKPLANDILKIEKEFVVKLGTIDKTTSLIERQKLMNAPNTVKIKNDDGTIDIVSKASSKQEEPAHVDKASYKKKGFKDSKVAYVRNGKVEVLKKEALDGKFTLSLGSFKTNVPNKQVNEIASISDVESMETFNPDETTYTVGNFDNPEEAKQRMEELVSQGFKPELIKYEDGKIKAIDLISVFDKTTIQKLNDLEAKHGIVKTGGVVFRVQLGAYRGKIKETVFRGVKTLAFPSDGGITKYVTGSFATYQQSYVNKLEMKQLGFSGAFVVAYKDGIRISVTDLVNKEKFKQVKQSVSPIEKQLKKVEEKPKKTTANKTTTKEPVKNKIIYRVQVGAFKDDAIQNKLTEFPDVTMEVYGQYKRYTSGSFSTYEEASKHKAVIKEKGFKGAFVVAYNGADRVAAPGENTNVIKKTDLVDAVKTPVKSKYDANKLLIMVQVGLYRGSIPADLKSLFNTLPDITKQVTPHGVVRYMTGNFKTPSEAAAYKEDLVKQGFEGAFLVAYYDNDRIKIQEAIEISQGK